jgi:hypothetical protein
MNIGTWPAVLSRALSAGALATLLVGAIAAPVAAQVVQGQLELQWGDPVPAEPVHIRRQPILRATLLTDQGERIALDAEQARRAAGDLYALINRRVAVSFMPRRLSQSSQPLPSSPTQVEVIVPADRLTQQAPATDANGRISMAAAVSGNTRWVTVMCKFSDVATEQKDQSFFQSQYGTAPGQRGHYWSEVSYGKVNLAGSSAHGWYVLPHARSTYVPAEGKANLSLLFQDCAAAADPYVDFTGVQGINRMFNGNLDGYAWGGSSCTTLDGVRRCPRVTWNPPWSFTNLAPLAHEMGHGYGLPHSDNSDDDDTYDNPWDLMSDIWSNVRRDANYGALPKHVNIQQRDRLSWVDSARKTTIAAGSVGVWQIALDYASLAGAGGAQMVVLALPPQSDPFLTVIYTLEARRPIGNYDAALAGDAVIIHRVEGDRAARSMDASVPPANVSNNEGSMFKPGETWNSPEAAYWVRVDSKTATGFLVTIGTGSSVSRVTGGVLPARRGTAPVASSSSSPSGALPSPSRSSSPRRSPVRWDGLVR